MSENVWYDRMKSIIEASFDACEDGRITLDEAWFLMLVLGEVAVKVIDDSDEFSEDDKETLESACQMLFDDYVEPLDLPGPDAIVDPFLRNVVIPGIVDGAFKLVVEHDYSPGNLNDA